MTAKAKTTKPDETQTPETEETAAPKTALESAFDEAALHALDNRYATKAAVDRLHREFAAEREHVSQVAEAVALVGDEVLQHMDHIVAKGAGKLLARGVCAPFEFGYWLISRPVKGAIWASKRIRKAMIERTTKVSETAETPEPAAATA